MDKIIAENTEESILPERKFAEHKLMTKDLITKLFKNGFNHYAGKVKRCGSWLLFSHQQHVITAQQRLRLKKANFCRFRFCPMCQWRRTRNICRELLAGFSQIEEKYEVKYLFLTLTVKNPLAKDLKKTVKKLNESFKRMSETQAYESAVLGHFKAIEILGDKTPHGEVHPHLHVLCIVSKSYFTSRYYLSQKKWTAMWQKALRAEYNPQVDVRRIRPKNKKLTALESAVFEVAKYSIKSSNLVTRPDADFCEIIRQTHRMRFYATGGILKLNLQRIEEQLINFDEKNNEFWVEMEELLYKWKNDNYFLTKKGEKNGKNDGQN